MTLLNSISVPITPKTSRPAPPYHVTVPTHSVRFDPPRDTLGVTKRLLPVRAPTELCCNSVELQLQLRRLELEAEWEDRQERREERCEARQQQYSCRWSARKVEAWGRPSVAGAGTAGSGMLPNTRPIRCTPYRLHPEKREFLRKELVNLLQLASIEESDSRWASPIVMVPKSDGYSPVVHRF